tara:strand:- start:734 stop:961 length:228 start_codon:yes stop_codon:yes gene_type:complete
MNRLSKYRVGVLSETHYRYGVYEVDTLTNHNVLLQKHKNKKKAVSVCKGLNSGKGFAGFTPHFICIDKVQPQGIL